MRRLDFISKAPNFSIFKEGANKTNLGGVLFMIYIIIIFLLAIVYFFDYFTNDKYQFNYSLVKGDGNNNTFLKNMEKIELNYTVYLSVDQNILFNNKNFIIVDLNKFPNNDGFIINQDKPFIYSVKDLKLGVLYRCNGNNCTIRDEDKIEDSSYYLNLYYKRFSINHQDPEKPIKPKDSYYTGNSIS